MTPAEILEAAADYIDAHGLHRGSLGVMGGPVCGAGGINIVAYGAVYVPGRMERGSPVARARKAVEEYVGNWLPDWSDASDRETVTRTFREVAAKEAAKFADPRPQPAAPAEEREPEPVAA